MTPKELTQLALPILQGLLASGDFTQDDPHDWTECRSKQTDNGEDWKENSSPRRFTCDAIEEAIALAFEFHAACESAVDDGDDEKESTPMENKSVV